LTTSSGFTQTAATTLEPIDATTRCASVMGGAAASPMVLLSAAAPASVVIRAPSLAPRAACSANSLGA
jgi:hypothetical protein